VNLFFLMTAVSEKFVVVAPTIMSSRSYKFDVIFAQRSGVSN
jgi:hypothetical protein